MSQPFERFTWKIGGEAGFGIKSAGMSFAKSCYRAGFEVFDYTEYPSLIRGGHNTYQITISDRPTRSVDCQVDLLVALNERTLAQHFNEMTLDSAIIYDADEVKIDETPFKERHVHLIHVPLRAFSKQVGADIMRNTVSLGASMALISLPSSYLSDIVRETFAHKPGVIDLNVKALSLGYDYIRNHYPDFRFKVSLKPREKGNRMYIGGNEATALGALAAGCDFYAGYPMTPSSGILHYMAAKAVSQNVIFKHAEDEIAVLNMALGAALVGARSMVATSGGGFALMAEALGLAGITETPVVIVNCQRPGPATGLPTWTGQADLRFMMHAAQDEFPRIILAPGDIEECFYMTASAFNLTERYQTPVIILSDKTLGEGAGSVPAFDELKVTIDRGKLLEESQILADYKRYEMSSDGISPRTLPGMKGGIFCANSDEHDEYGYSNEESSVRIAQVDKRNRKLDSMRSELDGANLYGPKNADITVVAWGSTKGAVLDAFDLLPSEIRNRFRLLHIHVLWPFNGAKVEEILRQSRRVILIEGNSLAQLGGLIRQETGILIDDMILRYDGRSFFANEVKEKLLAYI
ncbi:2-oxoacid:acceptor oxidoreductase subunit alpha [Candidatus Peregrinibacteria bacterium]|nr:2-oxoacid:acceptor oxidoreductase subunit alpha [Candidatus Peregrinibacteria bacterium]